MASELQNYLTQVRTVISKRSGDQFAKHLEIPLQSEFSNQLKQFGDKIRHLDFTKLCENYLSDQNTINMVAFRLSALVAILNEDYETAYRHEHSAYNAVVDYFSNKDEDTTWFIPVLVRVSNNLRSIAEKADDVAQDINNKFLRESLNSLTRGWTIVAKDKIPLRQGSKKLAIFAVTNVLFKIYFRVNTLQLCGKLINVVEGPTAAIMDNLRLFPVCDVTMYKYYIGRLKMFEDRYEEARECLRFALRFCPQHCVKNKQRILASLVPVEMCLGVMPSQELGRKYGLHELLALGEATRLGDIKSFEALMLRHQASFVHIGVYLVLEQVKIIAYRNLLKRIFLITNSTRLSLGTVETVFRTLSVETDLDEIECLLSNLIFQGKVKGYISHQKSFLVLSKTDPFPNTAIVKKVC